jgi:hypothetical protein
MNIGISLIRLRGLMERSKKHKWNNYFALPDIGTLPNLKPLPASIWALGLAKKLDMEREQ